MSSCSRAGPDACQAHVISQARCVQSDLREAAPSSAEDGDMGVNTVLLAQPVQGIPARGRSLPGRAPQARARRPAAGAPGTHREPQSRIAEGGTGHQMGLRSPFTCWPAASVPAGWGAVPARAPQRAREPSSRGARQVSCSVAGSQAEQGCLPVAAPQTAHPLLVAFANWTVWGLAAVRAFKSNRGQSSGRELQLDPAGGGLV